MDYLLVKDLEIYANHGVFQSEKELGQKFLVTLKTGGEILFIKLMSIIYIK